MENVFLKALILFVLIIILDTLWFGVMKGFYHAQSGKALKAPNYYAATATYLLLAYAVLTYTSGITTEKALLSGATLGFVIYGVYNLTNLAAISHWTPKLAFIDTLWGTITCSILSYVKFLLN
ncbi:DUF2177 family protein [Candidatus Pacearchaeota archaeon]|nr:DUF2177 family protein [Candidatus Pacearchaeota archaeon]